MHDLNDALDELRSVIPYAHSPSVRKLSKIATLLLAKNYILMQANALDELRRLVGYPPPAALTPASNPSPIQPPIHHHHHPSAHQFSSFPPRQIVPNNVHHNFYPFFAHHPHHRSLFSVAPSVLASADCNGDSVASVAAVVGSVDQSPKLRRSSPNGTSRKRSYDDGNAVTSDATNALTDDDSDVENASDAKYDSN